MAKLRRGTRLAGTKRMIVGGAMVATGVGALPGVFIAASGYKARVQTKGGLKDTTRLGRFSKANGGNFIKPGAPQRNPKAKAGGGRVAGGKARGQGMSRSQAASIAAKARWGRGRR
jgi:hypothetical protein